MLDIDQVIIARNKEVSQEMIDLANESTIVLMKSSWGQIIFDLRD